MINIKSPEFRFSGIYCIRNVKNNKKYIGSSVDIYERIRHHLSDLRNNRHHSTYLQRSFNKYGEQGFTTDILEKCNRDVSILRNREKFWMSDLKPEYNNMLDPVLYIHSQNSLDKISKTLKQRYKKGEIKAYNHPNKAISTKVYNFKEELVGEYYSIKQLQQSIPNLEKASIKGNLRKGIYISKDYIIVPNTLTFEFCIESTLKVMKKLPVVNIRNNDIILLKGREFKNVISISNRNIGKITKIRKRDGIFLHIGFIKKLTNGIDNRMEI